MQGQTPTPFPPHTGKVDRSAELVPDHVIPVYKLWVVKKKKKVGPILLVLTRGQQRLERKKKNNNMGGSDQPLTVKYKKMQPSPASSKGK